VWVKIGNSKFRTTLAQLSMTVFDGICTEGYANLLQELLLCLAGFSGDVFVEEGDPNG
jgi:hypothetical protein